MLVQARAGESRRDFESGAVDTLGGSEEFVGQAVGDHHMVVDGESEHRLLFPLGVSVGFFAAGLRMRAVQRFCSDRESVSGCGRP